jgi:hypothetical protein
MLPVGAKPICTNPEEAFDLYVKLLVGMMAVFQIPTVCCARRRPHACQRSHGPGDASGVRCNDCVAGEAEVTLPARTAYETRHATAAASVWRRLVEAAGVERDLADLS